MVDEFLLLLEPPGLQISSATPARSEFFQLHAMDLLKVRCEAFDRTGLVTFPICRNMVTISMTTTTDRVGAMIASTVLIEAIIITETSRHSLAVETTIGATIIVLMDEIRRLLVATRLTSLSTSCLLTRSSAAKIGLSTLIALALLVVPIQTACTHHTHTAANIVGVTFNYHGGDGKIGGFKDVCFERR
jgi:hypothetical protein